MNSWYVTVVFIVGSIVARAGVGLNVAKGFGSSVFRIRGVTFKYDVAPMLKTHCQPCHFAGGKVYGKLPFDKYFTVKKLGKKLNTRFKEREQQSLVDRWVASGAPEE